MRRVYVKRTDHVDNATGEVTHSEEQSSFFVRSRHFVKFYFDQAHLLQDVSGGARYLLDIMLVEMEFNTNIVYIGKEDRDYLANVLRKSTHTVRNYLYELEKADVIAKTGVSIYKVNPNLYEKGGDFSPDTDRPSRNKNYRKDNGSPI